MKKVLQKLGLVAFWILWPVWLIYFRLVPNRSRVFVIADGELLLLTPWLGGSSWGLPGGGARRRESIAISACRELHEEVGISVNPGELQAVGSYMHRKHGLQFRAHFFVLRLEHQPQIALQRHEIADAIWVNRKDILKLKLNDDTRYGLDNYDIFS